jgi:hypothetical protein
MSRNEKSSATSFFAFPQSQINLMFLLDVPEQINVADHLTRVLIIVLLRLMNIKHGEENCDFAITIGGQESLVELEI